MPFYSKDGFSCSCNKNECDECMTKYLVKTNADQIRAMTDEELATWIYMNRWNDIESLLEWLKQESES